VAVLAATDFGVSLMRNRMKPFHDMPFLIFQGLHSSTSTLSIMSDATSHAISEMYKWQYTDKYEMKHLGGTLMQMREKLVEFLTLGISKMVEDFFNDLKRYKNIELKIWDSFCDSVKFSKEVRLVRHLGNVIKHNNSVLDSSIGGRSVNILINDYGFPDDTPIHWLNVFKEPERDSILEYIYMANHFCCEILKEKGLLAGSAGARPEGEDIVSYMLKVYVHSITGHPEKGDTG
jgi:hypothetical protein